MELDELKSNWEQINSQLAKQKNLTPKGIDKMTKAKYHGRLNKIIYPEIMGAIVCALGAIYIGISFYKLDTPILQIVGFMTLLLLLILPVLSLISLRKFMIIGDPNNSHVYTLRRFAVQKIRFNRIQKISITLSYLLMAAIIILSSKLLVGKDITLSKYFDILAFSLGYIFILFFSKWVLKNYNKSLREAEELLNELDS